MLLSVFFLAFFWPSLGHSAIIGRQVPANATGVQTITSPGNVTIRYKEPGKAGVCETTPGVNSYSGYIDLNPTTHMFFWFFEARNNPSEAPITVWLNGGPGSDSLIGLMQENGPCNVSANLTTSVNPYSWNNVSNMLYISQPVGVGFSYSEEGPGTINSVNGDYEPASFGGVTGQWPIINATAIDTTELAAAATWHTIQAFLTALPQLDSNITSRSFNLWTESYGGHYGPAFSDYIYQQNLAIANGSIQGVQLSFDSLGIGNGIIDEYIQAPYYPEFAIHNTYNITAVNSTVYNYMKFAYYMSNGCRDQIDYCRQTNRTSLSDYAICSEAQSMCRDNVESPYYEYSGRGTYDIRHPSNDPTPPSYFEDYLNLPFVQDALGVNLNYSSTNYEVYYAFQITGDFIYDTFIADLGQLLDDGVRVALYYGDADYICNWFGGQAISESVNFTHSAEFRSAEYLPFVVDGTEYGEVRQYGNFSFLRVYESGHEVPYYQPIAAFGMFERVLLQLDLADGTLPVTGNYVSNGTQGMVTPTHTETFVALPTSTTSS